MLFLSLLNRLKKNIKQKTESRLSLEKGMAAHCRILAWKIPWTEEPGQLQFHGVAKESDMT